MERYIFKLNRSNLSSGCWCPMVASRSHTRVDTHYDSYPGEGLTFQMLIDDSIRTMIFIDAKSLFRNHLSASNTIGYNWTTEWIKKTRTISNYRLMETILINHSNWYRLLSITLYQMVLLINPLERRKEDSSFELVILFGHSPTFFIQKTFIYCSWTMVIGDASFNGFQWLWWWEWWNTQI